MSSAAPTAVERTSFDALFAKWSAWYIGYRPVTSNPDIYSDVLQQVVRHLTVSPAVFSFKRQSPLINAGYGARLASIAGTVQQFIAFHNHHGNPIDIIVMGCGLDVLGLWMYSMVKEKTNVRIIEVDTPQICATKRNVLSEVGLIVEEEVNPSTGVETATIIKASIRLPGSCPPTEGINSSDNYILLAGDLRDVEWMEQALSFRANTNSRPTLVVLELVLAYLGQANIDRLLQFCANKLCTVTGSVLVALEPLGPDKRQQQQEQHNEALFLPVGQVYRDEYCRKFQTKLACGIATSTSQEQHPKGQVHHEENNCFTPLGHSCEAVEERLVAAGFHSAFACHMGVSAAWAQTTLGAVLRAPEPFDEHSALLLHLTSYVLVCAFSDNSIELQRSMCGWSERVMTTLWVNPSKLSNEGGAGDIFTISEIQSSNEDQQVRDIFRNIYAGLFEEYPAVKRMVKNALKADLAAGRGASVVDGTTVSSIGRRYRNFGGIFVVAVKDVAIDQPIDHAPRQVVGFVGVRTCGSTDEACYEIQRLAVDEAFRRNGISAALLHCVETSIFYSFRHVRFQLTANTPSVLTAANEFYITSGFTLKETNEVANLTLNTYFKEINDDIT